MKQRGASYKIISRQKHPQGVLLKIGVKDKNVEVLLTHHSLDRMVLWGLSEGRVLETLLYPEEVLIGHYGRYIAHRRLKTHVVRTVYEYQKKIPVLITVYCPLTSRYFEGKGRYENKILT